MPQLREFRWRTDRDPVLSFQSEIYESNFPGFKLTPVFLRDYEQQIRRASRHPGEQMLVLEDDLGLCGFIWMALVTTMVDPFVGYIKNIYVAPRLRGLGYGKVLLDAADDWFKRNGCSKATLDASVCNARAVDVYVAAGYEPARYRMEKQYNPTATEADETGD